MSLSRNFVLGVSVIVFLSVLNGGDTLECYTCKQTSRPIPEYKDPCKNKEEVMDCGPNNTTICLAAAFVSRDKSSNGAQYEIHKSCYPAVNDPCRAFLSTVKRQLQFNPKLEFSEQCYVCNDSKCNEFGIKPEPTSTDGDKDKASTLRLSSLLLVVGLFGCLLR
ncbi:hypothetical protein NQ317_006617 [Molorchus minor]|uniref:Protein quiver n=1 Tax=Molorchus minor TaxID=1323400 RepID=A0ABQ9K1W8_9CUCU|nr:hypothetical protein NQ317_006617 [Molorchus minor]